MTNPHPVPLLQVRDLSLRYSGLDLPAFQNISTEVQRGEFVSVIGPSGCGKSTFLKALAHLIKASSGDFNWQGGDQPSIAFIFQDPTLLPWKTAQQNVEIPLQLQGVKKEDRQSIAAKVLEQVLLKEKANTYPKALSGGMRMRVSIARALSVEPEMMFLDEPFAALDAITRHQMNHLILELQNRQKWAALMVTHSVNEAVYMSDRVLVMSGTPGEIVDDVKIDLERPRVEEIQNSPEFLRHVQEIREILKKGRIT
ncbi:MAG: ABC transporter ATP-binding protein [Opitutales bacterium]|nr:ABC transporter ATP-binding protein [Opitutales bacterium]